MLRPLGANVVVKADAVEEKTKSGIFIPDTASKEKPMQGVVLAVGNGAIVDGKRVPVDVKVGDSVVFAKYCGTQVKFNGEELLILAERDILAVVEPDKKMLIVYDFLTPATAVLPLKGKHGVGIFGGEPLIDLDRLRELAEEFDD